MTISVSRSRVTQILASHWSRVIMWLGYWPLIGRLGNAGYGKFNESSEAEDVGRWNDPVWPESGEMWKPWTRSGFRPKIWVMIRKFTFLVFEQPWRCLIIVLLLGVCFCINELPGLMRCCMAQFDAGWLSNRILASHWSRVITWPWYWPLISQECF